MLSFKNLLSVLASFTAHNGASGKSLSEAQDVCPTHIDFAWIGGPWAKFVKKDIILILFETDKGNIITTVITRNTHMPTDFNTFSVRSLYTGLVHLFMPKMELLAVHLAACRVTWCNSAILTPNSWRKKKNKSKCQITACCVRTW